MSPGIGNRLKGAFIEDLERGFRGATKSGKDLFIHSVFKIVKTPLNGLIFACLIIRDVGSNLLRPDDLFYKLQIRARTLQHALTNFVGTIIGIIPIVNKIAFDHLLKGNDSTEGNSGNFVSLSAKLRIPEHLLFYV